jgi:HSP20 family protein
MAVPVRRRREQMSGPQQGWSPFREFDDLQQATQQIMESVLSGAPVPAPVAWTPPVDIEETDDAWMIEAELPGVSRDDINVEVHDNEIAITGEIKERERKGILRRRTRRVGEFEFRAQLPGPLDPDGVEANVEDGVLTVRVAKPQQSRPRRIEIGRGRGGDAGGSAEG